MTPAIPVFYTNWRGEARLRQIVPLSIRFGKTEWHPEEQYLVSAVDPEDGQTKEFALKDCNFLAAHQSPLYPMSLQDQISSDIKTAMLAKDTVRRDTLRMLKSALDNAAIEKKAALEDNDVIAVIRKNIKTRQDSVESFESGGRPELAEKEKAEIAILNAYLPQALSAEDLAAIVKDAIVETGATSRKQMGLVMKAATSKAAGRVDGKSLSAEVQKQLV